MKNKIPFPEYRAQEPMLYCGRGVNYKNPYREDCYFYHSEPSMGGHISCCKLHRGLGNCPCENCDKYLSKSYAFNIVIEHMKTGGTENESND